MNTAILDSVFFIRPIILSCFVHVVGALELSFIDLDRAADYTAVDPSNLGLPTLGGDGKCDI